MNSAPSKKLWSRDFTILWLGLVQSYIGDAFLAIGLMWLVLDMTGSPTAAATLVALGGLPKLLGPLAGVLVDRSSKRKLMIGADLVRGVILIAIYILRVMQLLQVWHLYALVILLGAMSIVYGPSLRVLLPNLVANESLPAANSLLQGSLQLAMVLGTSLAGIVLAMFGTPIALLVDGISFLLASVVIWFVHFPPQLLQTAKLEFGHVFKDMLDGLRFIVNTQEVLLLTVLAFFLNLVLSPINIILPFYSEKVLGSGVEGFGFLASAISIGLLMGNLLAGTIGDRIPYARTILLGLLGMTAVLASLSMISLLWPALILTAALGMMAPVIQVPAITRLQRTIPPGLQGRVFATWEALVTLSIPIAAGVVGQALVTMPVPVIFGGAAIGTLLVTLLWSLVALRRSRHVMSVDQPSTTS